MLTRLSDILRDGIMDVGEVARETNCDMFYFHTLCLADRVMKVAPFPHRIRSAVESSENYCLA